MDIKKLRKSTGYVHPSGADDHSAVRMFRYGTYYL